MLILNYFKFQEKPVQFVDCGNLEKTVIKTQRLNNRQWDISGETALITETHLFLGQ